MEAFSNFLPLLQSMIDYKTASVALECNAYSIDTCEIIMTLLLQTILTVIDNNKNSPEKIEQITALLIATRVNEAV